MANRRMIASDLFEDDFIGSLSFFERLLWIGLITAVADDQGRLIDNPALIRARVFLFDQIKDSDVEQALDRMGAAGRIVRYQSGNKRLVQIINWWRYQTPSWASPSKYPPPDGWVDRVKCHTAGGKIDIKNWDSVGGYVGGYIAPYVDDSDTPIDRPIDDVKDDVNDEDEVNGSDQPFRLLFDAFLCATGLPETNFANGSQIKVIDAWVKSGYTADEVHQAVTELQDKDMMIARPASITNALAIVRARNKNGSSKKQRDEDAYRKSVLSKYTPLE